MTPENRLMVVCANVNDKYITILNKNRKNIEWRYKHAQPSQKIANDLRVPVTVLEDWRTKTMPKKLNMLVDDE